MKLAAVCCTYRRPHLLGHLIESFLRQNFPAEQRELIILDDAGQYACETGDGWRLISIPRRFRTLGEKRNACAALVSPDVEGLLVADDDDIYLPHWFQTQAEALKRAEWSRPSQVLVESGDELVQHPTGGLFHSGWAFRRAAFNRVRGYSAVNNGEDQELASRLSGVAEFDPSTIAPPFCVIRNATNSYHLSWLNDGGYDTLAAEPCPVKVDLDIGWPRDYDALPRRSALRQGPRVADRDDYAPVQIVRPVNQPGRDGPTNGMYALQQAIRKRIGAGLDWIFIKDTPVASGVLPWFWCWADRSYAVWWAHQQGHFIQGPNVLFIHSARPRIDEEECRLLDHESCLAMFCHTEWYRELIAKYKGPANTAPIVLWPYPIDPWPGEPVADEYDLLIYAKTGYSQGLLEHLITEFPRHARLQYGKYEREELFSLARRSRACAFLADDESGPIAAQEIMLAGCPIVGVRTGVGLVRDGTTGFFIERIPPGPKEQKDQADAAALKAYCLALERAQELDRVAVRQAAAREFATDAIVDKVIGVLDECRKKIRAR